MKRIHAPVPLSVVISTVAGLTAIWLVDLPMLELLAIAVIAYGLSAVAASFIVSQEGTQPHPYHEETEADARDFVLATILFSFFGYLVTTTVITAVLRMLAMVSDYLTFLASPWPVVIIMFISGWFVFPAISVEYKAVDHEEQ